MDIRGATAIITGASSGIGLALAEELADRGLKAVALLARRAGPLDALAESLNKKGVETRCFPVDVKDEGAMLAAIQETEAAFGSIDIAVANAGLSDPKPVTDPDNGLMRHIFEVNVFGAAYLFHGVIPGMITRGKGSVIGISSIAGFRGLPGNGVYSASKSALTNLLEAYRVELEPHGLEVMVVSPGYVKTPLLAKRSFNTPFVVEVDESARLIANAIEAGTDHLVFPWQVGMVMSALAHLPQSVYKYVAKQIMAQRQ